MLPRTRLTLHFIALFFAFLPLAVHAAPVADSAEDDAEAKRLYDRAHDYVVNIPEGDYSYAYMQFHWKRSQANLERIARVYPATPAGRSLAAGQLKLGAFEPAYFRDRVLSRLEEKRVAAYDAVNNAIFLYNFTENRWDDTRRAALGKILEVLSRQQRWSEALQFPVLDTDKAYKAAAIFRVAARFEVEAIVKQLLAVTPKADLPATHALLGEALALRGRPRTEIAKLLDQSPDDVVKLGVLSGMIEREVAIQRAAALRLPTATIFLAGGALQRPTVRDDIAAVTKTFFPSPTPASTVLLDTFHAALGTKPANQAAIPVHLAYLEYLAIFEKFDELESYVNSSSLPQTSRQPVTLKAIELYAQVGRLDVAERLRAPFVAAGDPLAATSALFEFRGQMNSTAAPLTVHPKTFSSLPITDTCVLAQAIMEWSLTPNRAIRGAAPYDSVVQKFLPGFANIPAPKSDAVRDASSALKPY